MYCVGLDPFFSPPPWKVTPIKPRAASSRRLFGAAARGRHGPARSGGWVRSAAGCQPLLRKSAEAMCATAAAAASVLRCDSRNPPRRRLVVSGRKLTSTSLRRYPEGIVRNPVILSESPSSERLGAELSPAQVLAHTEGAGIAQDPACNWQSFGNILSCVQKWRGTGGRPVRAIGHALFATAGQPSNEDVPLQGWRCPAAAKPFGQGREAHEDLWLLWAAQEAHGHLLWHPARVNVHQAQCAISCMFRPRSLCRAEERRCISAHRSEFPSRLFQPFPEAHKGCAAVADTEGLILPLKCSVIMAPS